MRQGLLIICCMLAVLFSCAHPRKSEFESVRTQSQKYYETGEYKRALDGYRRLHFRFPDDPDLTGSYADMVEAIKKQSDRAYAGEDYAAAYRICRLLTNYYDNFSGSGKKLSFPKSLLNARIKSSQIKLAENNSQLYISSGDFQKAIDVCGEVYRKYRKDDQARKCLVAAAGELGEKGNTAYNNADYAAAGKVYRVLRVNAGLFKKAEVSGAPDTRTINTRVADCAAHLNRKGLELYRKGDLAGALGVWKEILEFDPDNADVIKAVETTSSQIKNMQ